MRIVLNIEEEDIERIARSLDNQYSYTLARNLEDSGVQATGRSVSRIPEAWAGTSREPFQRSAGAKARTLIYLRLRVRGWMIGDSSKVFVGCSMPFSDSGLWIPREPPEKKSWPTGTLPVVVSVISVVLSSGIASFSLRESRINTKLAQRAYLGYKVELVHPWPVPSEEILQYRIMLTNFGNTSAETILVRPADFEILKVQTTPQILPATKKKEIGFPKPFLF